MGDEDYQDIFQFTREKLKGAGFSAIDERIMSDIHGVEGAFDDLIYYLKSLTDEIALGSDVHLSNVLRRVRRHVRTDSHEPIEGIRVLVSEEDRDRYGAKQIDFSPSSELGEIAHELRALIGEMLEDRGGQTNRRERE